MTDGGDCAVDTHTLIWHLTANTMLSPTARSILLDADAGNRSICVPSIVLVETTYLAERGRVAPDLVDRMLGFVRDPDRPYWLAALDEGIVDAVRRVPRDEVPDMPDRIIAATALHHGLPLMSKDERIRNASVVQVIW